MRKGRLLVGQGDKEALFVARRNLSATGTKLVDSRVQASLVPVPERGRSSWKSIAECRLTAEVVHDLDRRWPVEDIIVDGKHVGIIDWEIAGYFPGEWIRTNVFVVESISLQRWASNDPNEWCQKLYDELKYNRFEECISKYDKWASDKWQR